MNERKIKIDKWANEVSAQIQLTPMLDENENIKTITHQLIVAKLVGRVRDWAEKLAVPNLPSTFTGKI